VNAKLILGLSLTVNVVLVALLFAPGGRSRGKAESEVAPTPVISAAAPVAGAPVVAEPKAVTNTVVRQFTWESVESADYREYIRNLRAIGCPDETIRDIILADVNKLYDSKRKQVRGGPRKFEYWKAGGLLAGYLGDPETLKKLKSLEEEKTKVLLDLGIQPDAMNQLMAATGGNPMDTMFDFLSEGKRVEVMKIMTEFQSKMAEAAQDGTPDNEAIFQNQKTMEEAIRAALSPEEFQDYQLRFSMTANLLRQQITGFEPTEEEFLKVFKLKEDFDREYSPYGLANETEADQRKRMEAMNALNGRIREALGNERYSDYERAQDYSYQQLYQIAKKAELAPTVANEVYSMKRTAEMQAAQIRVDQNLSSDQRSKALQAIRTETERSMQQALGSQAWDQYNRPNNTWWLRNLAPEASGNPGGQGVQVHDTIQVVPTP